LSFNKVKFNLVGNTFTHLSGGNKGYSVHGKISKYIEWVQDGSGIKTFYIDDTIDQPLGSNSFNNYGWLLESKWISSAIDRVKKSPDLYLEHYDMIFTHDQELVGINEKFKFVPAQGSWIIDPKIYPKTKLVSMISSGKNWTDGHKFRLEWINNFRNKLDLYGRGFNEIQYKEEGLCDYMFSVAIENGSYATYFTEKILDCFLTGTIPVYYGAPDIDNYFNMDGVILLNDNFDISQLTLELYESKKYVIQDNLERTLKMEILEDYIWENYIG
jgi:hypothetical protein